MPEAGPPVTEPDLTTSAAAQNKPPRKPSMFADPVVRWMAFLAFSLVALFLALIVGALLTGATDPSGPRTVEEKEIALAREAISTNSADPSAWGTYIGALIADRQYARASSAIVDGKASSDDSATADFALAEARLAAAREQHADAVKAVERARKQIITSHERIIKAGGQPAQEAKLDGYAENYYAATLVAAFAYRELGELDKAIAEFDTYLGRYPRAADILIDRGNAKADVGDKAGAESDFKEALKYLPGDAAALAGLKRIGASQ